MFRRWKQLLIKQWLRKTITKEWNWQFPYLTRKWDETFNPSDAAFGSDPQPEDKRVISCDRFIRQSDYIQEYDIGISKLFRNKIHKSINCSGIWYMNLKTVQEYNTWIHKLSRNMIYESINCSRMILWTYKLLRNIYAPPKCLPL